MVFLGSPNEVILTPGQRGGGETAVRPVHLARPVTINPLILLVRKDLPVSSFDELIALARNPGSKPLSYGSVGYGSLYHFAGEDPARARARTCCIVPYKGRGPLIQDPCRPG